MSRTEAELSPLQSYLAVVLNELRGADAGEVATYIPELSRANPEWFSICVCTADGYVYEVGDSRVEFTIQSISKPFVYGAALQRHGHSEVLARVGVEPSGNPFNAILVDDTNRPFNPMVNAGAIVTTAMIEADSAILAALSRYAGRPLTVDESVYESERVSGDRNRAIALPHAQLRSDRRGRGRRGRPLLPTVLGLCDMPRPRRHGRHPR